MSGPTMIAASLALAFAVPFPSTPAAGPRTTTAPVQDDQRTRVAGVVVDEAGSPVEGATVIAVWRAAAGKARIRTSMKTGADGAFQAEAMSDRGAPRISVFADGFVFQAIERAEGEELEVVGKRILEVAFDLRLPDGSSPENASLRFEYPEETGLSPTFASWRGARKKIIGKSLKATVTVHAGLYNLPSTAGPSSRWVSAPIELDALTLPSSTVKVDLEERQVLLIEVIGTEAVSRGRKNLVLVVKASDFNEKDPNRSMRAARRERRNQRGQTPALPRSGGTRYLFDLEPGEYVVGYLRQSMHLGEWKRFRMGTGETRVRLEIEDPEARGSVTITCVDDRGRAIEATSISHSVKYTGGSFSTSSIPAQAIGMGEYKFLRSQLDPTGSLNADPDPDKRVELTFHAAGLGARTLEIQEGVDTYVVQFSPPASLEIRPVGKNPETFWLRITGEDADYERVFDLSTTPTVTIENIQATTLTVDWVRADEEFMSQFPRDQQLSFVQGMTISTVQVDVAGGKRTVELAAPAVHSVRVETLGFDPGTRLTLTRDLPTRSQEDEAALRRQGPARRSTKTGEDGTATFDGVGSGSYTLRAGTWFRPLTVDIDADCEVAYPRVDATALRVTMTDGAGTLAESGLKADDVLLGRNGVRFTSSDDLKAFLEEAEDDPIEVDVKRGATELELELLALGKRSDQGGYLRPEFVDDDSPEPSRQSGRSR